MPKLIENLQETILQASRDILLEQGYKALTIRNVAGACQIAVGTVYNYYASKDVLAAAVLLEDWNLMLQQMQKQCAQAQDMRAGLTQVYENLSDFNEKYREVWAGYAFGASQQPAYVRRHKMLIRQIAECIHQLTERFAGKRNGEMDLFLAENILMCTGSSEMTFASFIEIALRAF